MQSTDHTDHHLSAAQKTRRKNLQIGTIAGLGIGLALVLGFTALNNAGPRYDRPTAAIMPGAGALASAGAAR